MEFKIDTKTNHRDILVFSDILNDKLAEEMKQLCLEFSGRPPGNFIFQFKQATDIQENFAAQIMALQEEIYEQHHSIVFTGFNESLLRQLKASEVGDVLNAVPTLAEAVDIVSMEVLERDLLNDDE